MLSGDEAGLGSVETWAAVGASLFGAALIAGHRSSPGGPAGEAALAVTVVLVLISLAGIWSDARFLGLDIDTSGPAGIRSPSIVGAYGLLAILSLIAVVGFGLRYRRHGRDLDSWLTLAFTLVVFADLHYVLSPSARATTCSRATCCDCSRSACSSPVCRGRSARRSSAAPSPRSARASPATSTTGWRSTSLRSRPRSACSSRAHPRQDPAPTQFASTAAQQEAQFAVLALSSASGSAPFDAALRRYVDFLVADGELDVEMEVDPDVSLGPDEEIEVFRIVQEGLANAAGTPAPHADGVDLQREGRRVVVVSDNGAGIDVEDPGAGQGLKNMRSRAASIEGVLSIRSSPGKGTSIEVVLRPI